MPSRLEPSVSGCPFWKFHFASFSRVLLLPNFRLMAGQKTKTVSKQSGLKPPRDRSIKGGTKDALSQSAEAIEPVLSNNESESTNETEDDDDNQEGLEKLMKALGEDGLNDFDLAQLHTLTGTASSDEEGGGEDEGSSDEIEDGERGDEEDESSGGEIALDDEDVDSVDEDAVPRRKIAIDNKVRRSLPYTRNLI
jgi:rRNA-processing protein EBP2